MAQRTKGKSKGQSKRQSKRQRNTKSTINLRDILKNNQKIIQPLSPLRWRVVSRSSVPTGRFYFSPSAGRGDMSVSLPSRFPTWEIKGTTRAISFHEEQTSSDIQNTTGLLGGRSRKRRNQRNYGGMDGHTLLYKWLATSKKWHFPRFLPAVDAFFAVRVRTRKNDGRLSFHANTTFYHGFVSSLGKEARDVGFYHFPYIYHFIIITLNKILLFHRFI